MADADALHPPPERRLRTAGLVLAAVVFAAVILGLVRDVQDRLVALAQASSDSVQWALGQLEVDALLLRDSASDPDTSLSDVRKRFDIVYSRMAIFRTGTIYARLRANPDFDAAMAQAVAVIDDLLPRIDGSDDALRAALPDIYRKSADLRRAVRTMSLKGIDLFATDSDLQRAEMARTLRRIAGVTAALVVALIVAAAVLSRLYRRSLTQSLDNRMTTARLETIVRTSVDAIVVVDRGGRVLEFNPAAETIFGYARDEAFGGQVTDLIFPPETIPETISAIETQLIRQVGEQPRKQRIELTARRKDASTFPVELSVAAAENATGEIFVAFLRDISDRSRVQRDLTEARDQALEGARTKAEFLAVMSHEMRTPLNGLLGSVELLGSTLLTPSQREIVGVIEASGQILLHHVNSVLDISTAESGAISPAQTVFAVESLVREVVANQSGLASAAGNRIEIVEVAEPAGRVTGDPARLRQILLNLVGNAVKFTRAGTITIEIEAAPPKDGTAVVEFRVIDTGIGIDEADQARIFEDFVTLDRSYGRNTGGTGLGLGITRRLVRALGGTIGMESEAGQGSVFWVRLPFGIGDTTLPDQPSLPATAPDPQQLSVLVIEDNAINRFVLRALLEEVHHQVSEAVDGVEGIAQADAALHDVILMDISMPRLDGVEAARRIRTGTGASRDARIIAVTAHALPEDRERFQAAGIDDCLVKPITRSALARAMTGRQMPKGSALAPVVTTLPLIDHAGLRDLVTQLDPATAGGLLRRFVTEADAIVPRLAEGPVDSTSVLMCHRLAGSAATFGALRLGASLRAFETAVGSGSDLSRLRLPLAETWALTRQEFLALQAPTLSDLADAT